MNRTSRLFRVAGICMSMFAPALALADVPPAMDRCPSEAPVVISIKNVTAFQKGLSTMATTLKAPGEAMAGLKKAEDMLKLEGLNADGSAAVAVLSLDQQQEHPPLVMIVPVKDYAGFAKALGGAGSGVEEVKFENEPAFVKDLGNGFAALSPTKDLVEKFEGKSGHGKDLEGLMGATGKAIAESSDLLILANMKYVSPMMKEGLEEFKQQLQMAAAMAGGGGNQAAFDMIGTFADGFVRDASAGVLGFKATDAGLSVEAGAQFKEGSEFAGYLEGKGKASALMNSLPKQDFLLALALDTSTPGFKKIAKNIVEASKKDPEAAKMMSGMNPLESIDKIDGMAFCMGQTPALVGGLFLNTSMFAKTSDAAGYCKQMKEGFGNMNGKTVQGVTYTTTYQSGGATVADKPVDVWSMKMAGDVNDPAGQQIAQVQTMLFGPGGMSGYIAQADNGVVVTYSKNSDLMTKALQAAKGGEGLASDAGVKSVAAHLPEGRSFEMYFGIKSILETATAFMAMFGGGPQNFSAPADLPPIGVAGTANGGGFRLSTFVPTQVMVTFKALGDSMKGGDEMPAEPTPKDKAGQPKF